MKAQELNNAIFDEIFKELLKEKTSRFGFRHPIITTFDIAEKLWAKHRIPYKKEADVVREKMRGWWNSYKWRDEPIFHKIICGVAVELAAPMGYDYCALERKRLVSQSLIVVYPNQRRFKKLKEEKNNGV